MTILLFVLLPVLIVATYAGYQWVRNREPSSVESGINAFQREMSALSPDAAPERRRPERGTAGPGPSAAPGAAGPSGGSGGRPAPRRPGPPTAGPDAEDRP